MCKILKKCVIFFEKMCKFWGKLCKILKKCVKKFPQNFFAPDYQAQKWARLGPVVMTLYC